MQAYSTSNGKATLRNKVPFNEAYNNTVTHRVLLMQYKMGHFKFIMQNQNKKLSLCLCYTSWSVFWLDVLHSFMPAYPLLTV